MSVWKCFYEHSIASLILLITWLFVQTKCIHGHSLDNLTYFVFIPLLYKRLYFYFSIFWTFLFCKHFYFLTGFCKKVKKNFKFANSFEDSKSRARAFHMYILLYLVIKHGIKGGRGSN